MKKTALLTPAIYAAMIGMEMSYLYLGVSILRDRLGLSEVASALALSIYLLSFFSGLLTRRQSGASGRRFKIAGGAGIVLVTAVTVIAVWNILARGSPISDSDVGKIAVEIGFCALSWWLGNTVSRGGLSYRQVSLRFQSGTAAMLALTVLNGHALGPVFVFFLMGMLALAASRWQASVTSSTGVLKALPRRLFWPGILSIFAPAAIALIVFLPEAAGAVVGWLTAAGQYLVRLLALDRLAAPSGSPIQFDVSCATPRSSGESVPNPLPPPDGTLAPTGPVFLWLMIIVIFISAVAAIVITVRRRRPQRESVPVGVTTIQAATIRTGLFEGLTNWLKRTAKRLRQGILSLLHRLTPRGKKRSAVSSGEGPAVSVRALYRDLLDWAARHGIPRETSATPVEYLKALSLRLPHETTPLTLITGVYLRARYGRGGIAAEEFDTVRAAWQGIRGNVK